MTVLFLSRYSWRDHYFTNTVKNQIRNWVCTRRCDYVVKNRSVFY